MAKKNKDKRHQKAKAKRKAKQVARNKQKRQSQIAKATNLLQATRVPQGSCQVGAHFQDSLMAQVYFTRPRGDGNYLFAGFVVDLGCLGVKDTIIETCMSRSRLDEFRARSPEPMTSISFDYGAKIVEAGVAYARELGFEPHEDFERARLIYADANPENSDEPVECGKDGKPIYAPGPYDNVEFILWKLNAQLGSDGYEFVDTIGI